MVAAADGLLPRGHLLDGSDPTATLAGIAPPPDEALFWVWKQGKQYRWNAMRHRAYQLARPADAQPWELYDLRADIGETKILALRLGSDMATPSAHRPNREETYGRLFPAFGSDIHLPG